MRPTGVTVIGIIGIVLGVLGLCCSVIGLGTAGLLPQIAELAQQQGGAQSQELQEIVNNPTLMRLTMVSSLVGILLSLWLLIACILLLRMSPVGYTLMIAFSGVAILWRIAETVISFTVIGGNLSPSTMLGLIIGLIYPIAVLIVLTRPTIKEAFQRSF